MKEALEDAEPTDSNSVNESTNSLAELDLADIALNGEINEGLSEVLTNLLENSSAEVSNSESDLLLTQEDGNLADNESDVKDIEIERTSEAKPSTKEELQEEISDTGESEFVNAEAINGIEMSPSSASNNEDPEDASKSDSANEQISTEKVENSFQESEVVNTNGVTKDSVTENRESSNEENPEEPEIQHLTDGSQDELLPSSTETAADSSSYETPRSSEASPITTSEVQAEVITTKPTVTINGVPSRNSVADGPPIPPPRKAKKKGNTKGLSSSSLGGCFPMACAGSASPTLNLSRVDSVYGGSVRSR